MIWYFKVFFSFLGNIDHFPKWGFVEGDYVLNLVSIVTHTSIHHTLKTSNQSPKSLLETSNVSDILSLCVDTVDLWDEKAYEQHMNLIWE